MVSLGVSLDEPETNTSLYAFNYPREGHLGLKPFKEIPLAFENTCLIRNLVQYPSLYFLLLLFLKKNWKRSVFTPIPKKGSPKECSNYCTIALISHASKENLKILQSRLQQCMNCELPDVQAGFRKGRGTRDQIANIHWIIEKAREFQKNIYFCFIDYAKAFDCVDHNKL